MKNKLIYRLIITNLVSLSVLFSYGQKIEIDGFSNDTLELYDISLGDPKVGYNILKARVKNKGLNKTFLAIDIRTECISLGMGNTQKFHGIDLNPKSDQIINIPYELNSPLLARIILRLGKLKERYNSVEYDNMPEEWKLNNPRPRPNYFWRQETSFDINSQIGQSHIEGNCNNSIIASLNQDVLDGIKHELPDLIYQSRNKKDTVRDQIRKLFYDGKKFPKTFDKKPIEWSGTYDFDQYVRMNNLFVDVFSISSDDSKSRISCLFLTREENARKKLPLIIVLGGNPGGTKEFLFFRSVAFVLNDFHVLAIERRITARKLDALDKFVTNTSDPVTDAIRVLDFLENDPNRKYSNIGLYGFSKGAEEARFLSYLDPRINAVVLGCGTTSNAALFRDKERWIPTLSGFIIYDQIGLESPFGLYKEMTGPIFRRYKAMALPEHNIMAQKAYCKMIPEFNLFDAVNVVPGIAPTPLFILSGLQDIQFTIDGVTEVDRLTKASYRKQNLLPCYDFYIQPWAGHWIDNKGSEAIIEFFDRWLK